MNEELVKIELNLLVKEWISPIYQRKKDSGN